MSSHLARRDFLKSVPVAAYALTSVHASEGEVPQRSARMPGTFKLDAFDYAGVTLGPCRWQRQVEGARAFYLGLSDDDILHGFRKAAGLSAPGQPLGGWCGIDSNIVFGQWLSGMSRLSRATGDAALRDKAIRLFTEWARTVKPDGDARMDHYAFDKMVCGLVDLQKYAGHREADAVLRRIVAYADKSFARPAAPLADITDNRAYYGRPQEWYTLGENLLRAYEFTGEPFYRTFASVWFYDAYWNKFLKNASPDDAHGVHAYSHVNTFSSAAMAYAATGDDRHLTIIRHAYDYLQQHQCYSTGGYGPNERFMRTDGSLGRALDSRSDTFEAVCGSWAGFKLSSYLMRFTGEARYGDWIERLFYNGVGAALPIMAGGRNFYYADYRVGGGMKVYNWDTCTCCSGTYIQNMAAYHDLIYFKDAGGVYVNLFVPSTVTWRGPSGDVRITQDTRYPDSETTALTMQMAGPASFAVRFRVPLWASGATVTVNGAPVTLDARPGTWATIRRTWQTADRIEFKIPLAFRTQAVDVQHPDRVAVVRGPVVMALEGAYHDPNFRLPATDTELNAWLTPDPDTLARGIWSVGMPPDTDPVTVFKLVPPDKSAVRLRFRPFYEPGEGYPYFMYFDRKALPWRLW
jgi:hypothetical protein